MKKELQALLDVENATGNGSQKIKQDLITDNFTPHMEYLLNIAMNPYLTTKLNKYQISDSIGTLSDEQLFENFKTLTQDLLSAPAANDSLRERANSILNDNQLDAKERKMLAKVLTKSVNIGIGAKLINKAVAKSFIPDPKLMLAEDDMEKINSWPHFIAEEKYDGVRIIAVYKGEDYIELFTRSFNQIPSRYLQNIQEELLRIFKKHHASIGEFIDGELTDKDRKSVSGKVTSMLKGNPPLSIQENVYFNIFDNENFDVFTDLIGKIEYEQRRARIEKFFQDEHFKTLFLGRQWICKTIDEARLIYADIVKNGGEGIILKKPKHFYEVDRTPSWIKLKEEVDCDLIITGWYPGEGKREGQIGGWICEDKSKCIKVRVGSGFTKKDLEVYSKNPDDYMNSIAAVKYNMVINDKKGNKSLFLPRFIEIRHDKFEADDMSNIKVV